MTPPRKYYHTKDFIALQSVWAKKLSESAFDDIERSGEDGPLDDPPGWPGKPGTVFAPDTTEPSTDNPNVDARSSFDACVYESFAVQNAVFAMHERAEEAIRDPKIWRGLPQKARRWWALQIWCGWSAQRAKKHVGAPDKKIKEWDRIIRSRLGG